MSLDPIVIDTIRDPVREVGRTKIPFNRVKEC